MRRTAILEGSHSFRRIPKSDRLLSEVLCASFLLVACSCAQNSIVPDAQAQLQTIITTIELAQKVELKYCQLPPEPMCDAVRTHGYDAEASFTTANAERTAKTIDDARLKAIAYSTAARELVR